MQDHHRTSRHRGTALLLVLIAVATATILALSFLASQGPTAVIAANIDRKAKARAIAESALQMAIDYVNEDPDWRGMKSAGLWMSDAALDGGSFDLSAWDDDGDLNNDPADPVLLTAVGVYEGVTHRVSARITPAVPPFAMEAGTVVADGTPLDVAFQGEYTTPVVVCTPQVVDNSQPLVVRVDAVTGSGFRVWLQRCDGGAVQPETVHYMVMEQGVYNVDGVLCEARRYESTVTDNYRSWEAESRSYGNSYSNPVVFGQVMSANDPDWSVFWCSDSSVGNPPSSGRLYTGKHVGEDPDQTRDDETVGYIVFESGRHTINGAQIDVRLSSDNVMGVTNGSGTDALYHQSFSTTPQVVVATQAAMDGNNGSWATLWGASGITTTRARVIVDEDTLRDPERSHTNEQVGVIAFERPPDASAQQVVLQYEFDQVQSTPQLIAHWRLDEPAGGGGGVAAYDQVYMSSYAKIDSYDSSRGAYGPTNNAESASVSSNSTGSNKISLNSHNRIEGDAYIGPGGNPSSGIHVDSFSFLTGQKLEADIAATMPSLSPPGGLPADLGNVTYSSGTVIINTDLHFTDLTLSGDATVRIQGDVRIHVNDDFRMYNNSRVILDPGATLSLWLDDSIELRDNAQLNADSSATDRLTVYVYGNNERFRMRNSSVMAASVFVEGDFRMDDDAEFYGRVLAGDDVEMYANSVLHADIALPTLGIATTPAVDEVIANDGGYRGDVVGGGTKPTGLTPAGSAAVFDGSGDYIEIPHSDTYLLEQGTLSFWFNPDTTSGTQGLVYKDASGFGQGGHLAVYLSGSTLRARLSSDSQDVTLSSESITAGQWSHVALSFGAEGLALYVDGVREDSADYGGGLNTTSGGLGNREPIVIGADASGASSGAASPLSNYFGGRIDDVRLYDRWCSEQQAGEIMVGGAPSTRLSDTLVLDTSGYGDPAHLRIEHPSRVTWGAGVLTFDNATFARSLIDAEKVHTALSETDTFTLALRFNRSDPLYTNSPSIIMAVSDSIGSTNLLVGQDEESFDARVRTSATGASGTHTPPFIGENMIEDDEPIHLAIAFDGDVMRAYVDGSLVKSQAHSADLDSLSTSMPVVIGGAVSGGNAWRGTLDSVRLYSDPLTTAQVQNLYEGLAVNATGSHSGSVVWEEAD